MVLTPVHNITSKTITAAMRHADTCIDGVLGSDKVNELGMSNYEAWGYVIRDTPDLVPMGIFSEIDADALIADGLDVTRIRNAAHVYYLRALVFRAAWVSGKEEHAFVYDFEYHASYVTYLKLINRCESVEKQAKQPMYWLN